MEKLSTNYPSWQAGGCWFTLAWFKDRYHQFVAGGGGTFSSGLIVILKCWFWVMRISDADNQGFTLHTFTPWPTQHGSTSRISEHLQGPGDTIPTTDVKHIIIRKRFSWKKGKELSNLYWNCWKSNCIGFYYHKYTIQGVLCMCISQLLIFREIKFETT